MEVENKTNPQAADVEVTHEALEKALSAISSVLRDAHSALCESF